MLKYSMKKERLGFVETFFTLDFFGIMETLHMPPFHNWKMTLGSKTYIEIIRRCNRSPVALKHLFICLIISFF